MNGKQPGTFALMISATALTVVLLDQITKAVVAGWIGPGQWPQRWEIAGRILAFEYVENTGAAFGILAGRIWLLSILALVVAIGFILLFRKDLPSSGALRLSLGLVLGGAIGNLLDRLRLGHVVDFIAVGIWPRFNVADSAITIGLLLLFITAMRDDAHQEITS